MTKHHENLLRDSPLSLLFMVKFFSSLETKMSLKIPNETFLRITLYHFAPVDGHFILGYTSFPQRMTRRYRYSISLLLLCLMFAFFFVSPTNLHSIFSFHVCHVLFNGYRLSAFLHLHIPFHRICGMTKIDNSASSK